MRGLDSTFLPWVFYQRQPIVKEKNNKHGEITLKESIPVRYNRNPTGEPDDIRYQKLHIVKITRQTI